MFFSKFLLFLHCIVLSKIESMTKSPFLASMH